MTKVVGFKVIDYEYESGLFVNFCRFQNEDYRRHFCLHCSSIEDSTVMENYCVILEGDKNLSEECLSQMLLNEYLMRFFRTS